jgi:hypothetical protein
MFGLSLLAIAAVGFIISATAQTISDAAQAKEDAATKAALNDDAQAAADLEAQQAYDQLILDVGQLTGGTETSYGDAGRRYTDPETGDTYYDQIDVNIDRQAEEYASYDEWYNAQITEYENATDSGDFSGSLEEYISEQQRSELGAYGRARADMEFNYREGVIESNRANRNEMAMAGASGFTAGTPQATVTENDRVRQDALTNYLSGTTANLEAALQGARTGFEAGIESLDLALEQYNSQLEDQYWDAHSTQQHFLNAITAGVAGADAAFGVFSAGVDVGAWGFDEDMNMWTAWGSSPQATLGPVTARGF